MIGILPAAGKAERLMGLPKFLLPVGDTFLLSFHIQGHERAGVERIIIGTSRPFYPLLCEYAHDRAMIYPVQTLTQSETVLTARRFYGERPALMTMPDTWFEDVTVLERLVKTVEEGRAIVAAALWPIRSDQQGHLGQCLSRDGLIEDVIDKDPDCPYLYAWGAMAWSQSFWPFIKPEDPHPGYAMQRAITAGVRPRAVFADGPFYDLGTFAQYQRLCVDLQEEFV